MDLIADESINLDEIDTSHMTDMSALFRDSNKKNFDGIETWDVANVTDMDNMFGDAENFNQDISSWQVSSVCTRDYILEGATNFSYNISGWAPFVKIEDDVNV